MATCNWGNSSKGDEKRLVLAALMETCTTLTDKTPQGATLLRSDFKRGRIFFLYSDVIHDSSLHFPSSLFSLACLFMFMFMSMLIKERPSASCLRTVSNLLAHFKALQSYTLGLGKNGNKNGILRHSRSSILVKTVELWVLAHGRLAAQRLLRIAARMLLRGARRVGRRRRRHPLRLVGTCSLRMTSREPQCYEWCNLRCDSLCTEDRPTSPTRTRDGGLQHPSQSPTSEHGWDPNLPLGCGPPDSGRRAQRAPAGARPSRELHSSAAASRSLGTRWLHRT